MLYQVIGQTVLRGEALRHRGGGTGLKPNCLEETERLTRAGTDTGSVDLFPFVPLTQHITAAMLLEAEKRSNIKLCWRANESERVLSLLGSGWMKPNPKCCLIQKQKEPSNEINPWQKTEKTHPKNVHIWVCVCVCVFVCVCVCVCVCACVCVCVQIQMQKDTNKRWRGKETGSLHVCAPSLMIYLHGKEHFKDVSHWISCLILCVCVCVCVLYTSLVHQWFIPSLNRSHVRHERLPINPNAAVLEPACICPCAATLPLRPLTPVDVQHHITGVTVYLCCCFCSS